MRLVLVCAVVSVWGSATGFGGLFRGPGATKAPFADFNKVLEEAAKDIEKISPGSAGKLDPVLLGSAPEEDSDSVSDEATTAKPSWGLPFFGGKTTPAPTTPQPEPTTGSGWGFGGLFGGKATPAPTTPEPEPTTKGGWSFGGLFSGKATTQPPTPAPTTKKGWSLFGGSKTEPTTAAPEVTTKGGWSLGNLFGSAKNTAEKLVSTTGEVIGKITDATINGGTDYFMEEVKLFARAAGLDEVPLPGFSVNVMAGTTLETSGGFFKSLSSLARAASIKFSRKGTTLTIDIPLEINDMEVGYNQYKISAPLGITTSGSIKVGVKSNRINVRLSLAVSTSCAINLEYVRVDGLEGLEIDMTNDCSPCAYAVSKTTTFLVNYLNDKIKHQIQEQIDGVIRQVLSQNSFICSKFLGG